MSDSSGEGRGSAGHPPGACADRVGRRGSERDRRGHGREQRNRWSVGRRGVERASIGVRVCGVERSRLHGGRRADRVGGGRGEAERVVALTSLRERRLGGVLRVLLLGDEAGTLGGGLPLRGLGGGLLPRSLDPARPSAGRPSSSRPRSWPPSAGRPSAPPRPSRPSSARRSAAAVGPVDCVLADELELLEDEEDEERRGRGRGRTSQAARPPGAAPGPAWRRRTLPREARAARRRRAVRPVPCSG